MLPRNTLPSRPNKTAEQAQDEYRVAARVTIAAAVAFILANTTSLMDLSAVGRFASTTIPYGAYEMWMQGKRITAVIVAFCAVIAPAAYILFMLTVLIAVRRPPAPHWVGELLRWGNSMQPWSMGEVMILGIMVALVKIAELASVGVGIGMYAIGALVVLSRRDLDDVRPARGLEADRVGGRPGAF